MTTYNPPRPTRTIEIKRKAAEEFVAAQRSCLPSDIDDEDLIDHLIKHAHAHENGYEIAKLNHIGTELPADIKQLLYKYTQMEFGK